MITEANKNRVVMIPVTRMPFDKWFWEETLKQLPEDSVIAGIHADPTRNTFNIIVHSKEFEELKEGCELPRVTVTADGKKKTVSVNIPEAEVDFLSELGGI